MPVCVRQRLWSNYGYTDMQVDYLKPTINYIH